MLSSTLEGIALDVKTALRSLRKRPGFAVLAVATLALGIGANTAIFSVVDAVLLSEPPYPEPERIVQVWELSQEKSTMGVAYRNFQDWEERATRFDAIAAYARWSVTVLGGESPLVTRLAPMTSGFFDVFEVQPFLGRVPTDDEHQLGAQPVAVVSHGFWTRQLSARQDLSDTRLDVAGFDMEVIGVMPAGFEFPRGAEIWAPLELTNPTPYRSAHNFRAVGRLADGVLLATASDEIDAITAQITSGLESFEAKEYLAVGALARSLQEETAGPYRRPLLILLAASALVLLVACSNLAGTFLARGTERRGEMAVRQSLGAGALRLMRQLFTESFVIALLGAGAGLAVGYGALRLLERMAPSAIPAGAELGFDGTLLVFTLGLAVLTALAFGVLPALRLSKSDTMKSLRTGGRGGADTGERKVWNALVAAEVALAVMLLVGSGLLIRSFWQVLEVDLGFTPERVVTAGLYLPETRYEDAESMGRYYARLLRELESAPGVESVGMTTAVPLSGDDPNGRMPVERGPSETVDGSYRVVSAGYFDTLAIPLQQGRLFDGRDRFDGRHVLVVNRAMAQAAWPGEDPLGKRLHAGGMDRFWQDEDAFATVIGVVGDVRYRGAGDAVRPTAYFPSSQRAPRAASVLVRSAAGVDAASNVLRTTIQTLDDQVPVRLATAEGIVSDSLADRRFALLLLGAFAGLGLILAAVGIYGVVSLSVARRRRELGIRMALGADAGGVRALVLRTSMASVLVGLALGTGLALALTRVMESLLFEVEPTDPATFAAVLVLLATTAAVASWIPARRATGIQPTEVLRAD